MRPGEVIFRHAEPVMGTVVSFDVRPQGLPMTATRAAVKRACEVLHRADDVFSLYRPDTPLSRLRRGEIDLGSVPARGGRASSRCASRRSWRRTAGSIRGACRAASIPPGSSRAGRRERPRACSRRRASAPGWSTPPGHRRLRCPLAARSMARGHPRPGVAGPAHMRDRAARRGGDLGNYERGDHIWDVSAGRPAAGVASATVCGPGSGAGGRARHRPGGGRQRRSRRGDRGRLPGAAGAR